MKFDDQEQLAAYAQKRMTEQIERARAWTAPLSPEQRDRPREDGGWSIDQILRHLARVNETYLDQLEGLDLAGRTEAGGSRWKPTLGGRLIAWSMRVSFPVKTPRVFGPEKQTSGDDALEAFAASQQTVVEHLQALRGHDWNSLRCASPASGLVRLNVGDVFLIIAEHGDRHMQQLERQRDAVTRARTHRRAGGLAGGGAPH